MKTLTNLALGAAFLFLAALGLQASSDSASYSVSFESRKPLKIGNVTCSSLFVSVDKNRGELSTTVGTSTFKVKLNSLGVGTARQFIPRVGIVTLQVSRFGDITVQVRQSNGLIVTYVGSPVAKNTPYSQLVKRRSSRMEDSYQSGGTGGGLVALDV